MPNELATTVALMSALSCVCACAAHPKASATVPAAALEPPTSTFTPPPGPTATHLGTGFADVNTDNSLVSNGSVQATSDHLLTTASAFRREVYELGGRVYAEQVHFRDRAHERDGDPSSASYKVKILPRMLPDVLDWLGSHTTITVQEVSSIVAAESEADASIARADVTHRLEAIADRLRDPDLTPAERVALEQERAKLADATTPDPTAAAADTKRVAVLTVRLDAPRPPDPYADGNIVGAARGSVMDVGVLGPARSSRLGAGVAIGGRTPWSGVEVIGYAANRMDERAGVVATAGVGGYAKALGGGLRSMLNPYAAARLGYAYLDASYFALGAELGVEIVKQRGVLWTVSARPMGLIGSDSKTALEFGSTLGLAF